MRVRFFIDNNLSPQLAAGMKGFGEEVIHLRDEFPEDTDDAIWLEYVGENNLFLVTRDKSIRRRPIELQAFRGNNVGAFFLGGKNLTRCQLIQQLVRNWPRMKELARKERRPFAYRIPPSGKKFTLIPLT